MLRKLALVAFAFHVAGCSVYTNDDRDKNDLKPRDPKREKELKALQRTQCEFGRESGCIEGQIVVSQVRVEGASFFDAASIASGMKALVNLKAKDGQALTPEAYDLSFKDTLSNDTFADGFEAYLKGDRVRSGRSDKSGRFRFNLLEEGSYQLRIQKRFPMVIVDKRDSKNQDGAASTQNPAAASQARNVCLYLYADTAQFDLSSNEGRYLSFDQFKLRLVDQACQQAEGQELVVL